MSKAQAALRAYSLNGRQTKNLRAQEYDVILQVTRDLKRLQKNPRAPFNEVAHAVHRNETLWSTIGLQVVDNDNELPDVVRANLLYLSKFVTQQSSKVLQKESSLEPLVDINVSVLRGLKGAA